MNLLPHLPNGGTLLREDATARGERGALPMPLRFPVPVLLIEHGVYAAPVSVCSISDGRPTLSFVLDAWTLLDYRLNMTRELPIGYLGTDVASAMRGFAEKYRFKGQELYGADLMLFCDSWREATGVGVRLSELTRSLR